MRHFKATNGKNFKVFVSDNAEVLILGGISVIAIICGMIFSVSVKDIFELNSVSTPPILQLFLDTFIEISLYVFLIFFCGTSSVGFISPAVLAFRGFYMGCAIKSVDFSTDLSVYTLSIMPYIVLTFALLIQISKHSISLSLRMFRMCTGSSVSDLSVSFRRFILVCGISIVISAAISFIYALIYSFLLM